MNDEIRILNFNSSSRVEVRMLNVVDCLRRGGVIAHATETCYGLACDAFNEEALRKFYKIKGMPEGKLVSIMVRDIAEARRCAEFGGTALRVAHEFWPGPVTLVLPRRTGLPNFLNMGASFIGLRCSDHDLAQALLFAFGGPLVTTSANFSGEKEVYSASDVKLPVDMILDSGEIPVHAPSTVLKIGTKGYEILRSGELAGDIEQFLRS